MNQLRKQMGAIMLGMAVMFSSIQQVGAEDISSAPALVDTEESNDAVENSGLADVKDSVVQIVVEYVAESGKSYILKSGSGFLIGATTVLTDYDLLSLTDEEKMTAEGYLSAELGTPVSFSEVEGAQTIAARIGVVMYRDVIVTAEMNPYSSREMRLGILNLGDALNRSTAVLGDSSGVPGNAQVYTLGYKNVTLMQPGVETERLSQRDLKVSEGVIKGEVVESDISYLNHTAKISQGNDGGPTVDENGLVIGMNLYGGYEDGSYRTLGVNEIKELLESCEIPYQESGLSSISAQDIADARTVESSVDYGLLDDYILNYSLLEKSEYTEESYRILEEALANARNIKADKTATQAEIDGAVEQLGLAKAGLVQAKKTNWPFLITLGVLILAVLTALVLYILKLNGILFRKTEPEKLLTLSEMEMQNKASGSKEGAGTRESFGCGTSSGSVRGSGRREADIVMPRPRNSGHLGKGGESGGYKETTVLGVENPAQSEGTVVLGGQPAALEAYLIRKSNSDKIKIEGRQFRIGKDKSQVNYCVTDNPSISRCHAQIQQKDRKYYLSDLQSTNFTYLNGRILMSDEKAELQDNDVIRFSNEEYLFSIRKGD